MDTKVQELTRTTITQQQVLRTLRRPITELRRQLILLILPQELSLDQGQRLPQAENVPLASIGCRQVIIRQVGVCLTGAHTHPVINMEVEEHKLVPVHNVPRVHTGIATLVHVNRQPAPHTPAAQAIAHPDNIGQEVLQEEARVLLPILGRHQISQEKVVGQGTIGVEARVTPIIRAEAGAVLPVARDITGLAIPVCR